MIDYPDDFNVKVALASENITAPDVPPGYERLHAVLMSTLEQAAQGKGKERHAREGQAFEDQPMQQISTLLGSVDGMAFQAIKKLREGIHLPTPTAQVNELRGVINYVAGIIIYLENQNDRRQP